MVVGCHVSRTSIGLHAWRVLIAPVAGLARCMTIVLTTSVSRMPEVPSIWFRLPDIEAFCEFGAVEVEMPLFAQAGLNRHVSY